MTVVKNNNSSLLDAPDGTTYCKIGPTKMEAQQFPSDNNFKHTMITIFTETCSLI
jgi:hypothetical protein